MHFFYEAEQDAAAASEEGISTRCPQHHVDYHSLSGAVLFNKQCTLLCVIRCEHRQKGSSSDAAAAPLPVLDFGCMQRSFEQQLDHFNSSEARTWRQVYWVCGDAQDSTGAGETALRARSVFEGGVKCKSCAAGG